MRMKLAMALILLLGSYCKAQEVNYLFDFNQSKKVERGVIQITSADTFSAAKGYGYDRQTVADSKRKNPFYFSVAVPDGNYKVTVWLGSKQQAGETTVRGESRRLFIENFSTKRGEVVQQTFVINKRDVRIDANESVRIKPREKTKLNWDDKLTLEFNGAAPQLSRLSIERVDTVPTIFLCGNSTVVDQDDEPWASWGQMIPSFFTDGICFANYAESGESANTFIAAGRLKKILSQIKAGDYLVMEFGHNDQKQKGAGKGAYYSFATSLKTFIDEARAKGATPILITPTQRRSFDESGHIKDTHENFPEAMKWLAQKENIPLIDLNSLTRTLYEAMGAEDSKRAFVHYPANTYLGQTTPLADNTHFNPYGAYQIAKCVVEGMKATHLDGITKFIKANYQSYNPAKPDAFSAFRWSESPFIEIEKPDGN